MDTASSTDLVVEKAEIPKQRLSEIINDPKKTLIFMVIISVVGAVLFIIVVTISNLFGRADKVESLQNANKRTEVVVKTDFDTKRKADIEQLNSAISAYYSKNQIYPQSLSNLVPQYIATIPKDPETQTEYSYRVSIDLKGFEVWALLDDGSEYLLSSP